MHSSLMNFRLRPVYIFSIWCLSGIWWDFIYLLFSNLLCIMNLSKFERFLQGSLKGLFSRPWINSKYPKLVVNFEKARKSRSIQYKPLILSAFGGTLQALWTISLVFPFKFGGGAALYLSFFFTSVHLSKSKDLTSHREAITLIVAHAVWPSFIKGKQSPSAFEISSAF